MNKLVGNKLKIFLFGILLTGFMSVSHAKDLTQTDLNQASAQHYSSADFMLNKAYDQLMSALDKNGKEALKKAQKVWIKFRDLEASFAASQYEGGSIASLIKNQALTEITQNRTAALTKRHLVVITP